MRRNTRYGTSTELGRLGGFSRIRPLPPSGLRFADGVLQWDAPVDDSGVTHYRVYAETDTNLVRQLSLGQTILNDGLTAERVFVSCYNRGMDLESSKISLIATIAPVGGSGGGSGSGTGSNTTIFELLPSGPGTSTFNGPGGAVTGELLVYEFTQNTPGGRSIAWGVDFDASVPTDVYLLDGYVTVYSFYGKAGLWYLQSNNVWRAP